MMQINREPVVAIDYRSVERGNRCVMLGWCPWRTTERFAQPISNRVFSQRGIAPAIPAQSNNTVPQVLIEYD